ncbi:hypothetical protein X743_31470 [Mesorhizobium sp. LNHC252B00]|nr:hypothetical protein X743_31470 [Mesorhizobium sp. LNHC252B00]
MTAIAPEQSWHKPLTRIANGGARVFSPAETVTAKRLDEGAFSTCCSDIWCNGFRSQVNSILVHSMRQGVLI